MTENRRKLRVAVVDNSQDFLISTEDALMKNPAPLDELDIEFVPHLVKSKSASEENIVKEIDRRNRADIYIIGEKVGGISGTNIAKTIKAREKQKPLICVSDGPVQRNVNNRGGFIVGETYRAVGEKVFDAVWEKSAGILGLAEDIRRLAWKPLDIGVIGCGGLGRSLIANLLESPDIKNINVYSERAPLKKLYDFFEEDPRFSKIQTKDSLEEAVQDTDILALTTSTLRAEEVAKVVETPDRREALPYEIVKYTKLYRGLRETNFNGLIMPLANPVHLLMNLWSYLLGDKSKIFSPLEPDTRRLTGRLRANFNRRKYGEFISESPELMTGVHGMARLIIPEKWDYLLNGKQDKIEQAEHEADEMGKRALMASAAFRAPAPGPSAAIVKIFEDIASYRNPRVNCQYCNRGSPSGGVVSLPTEFVYTPELHVRVSKKRIQEIGTERVNEAITPFLLEQNDLVRRTITQPKKMKDY